MTARFDCALEGAVDLPFPAEELVEAILAVATESTFSVTVADRGSGTLRGRLPTTLFFWGPEVALAIEPVGPALSLVRYGARAASRRPGQQDRFREYVRARLSRLLQDASATLEPDAVGAS